MAVHCGKCGQRLGSRAELPGHYRRAHGRRGSAALVPLKPRPARPEPIRAEIVPVAPSRLEIVRPGRESVPAMPILARSEPEPEWFAREFPQDARAVPWRNRDEDSRAYYRRAHGAVERSLPRRPAEGADSVTLWEQYHFLKALAV